MNEIEIVLVVVVGLFSAVNLGSLIKVGGIIKSYGSLVTKVNEHDNILHDGIIDKLDDIDRKVAVFEGCPPKIDELVREQSEMKGTLNTYMKMKK